MDQSLGIPRHRCALGTSHHLASLHPCADLCIILVYRAKTKNVPRFLSNSSLNDLEGWLICRDAGALTRCNECNECNSVTGVAQNAGHYLCQQ